jgi:hypothetical protein
LESNPAITPNTQPPQVVMWFKVYAGLMVLMYLGCIIGGAAMIYFADELPESERMELYINGGILALVGVPFSIVCALPFFFPRKPWVWIYNIVIIAIGLTSCCCIPACVPLLIYWLKPEVKMWFGRSP